jgi:2Fe-2S ferredoxin
MTKITFIEFGGAEHEIDVANGQSLMTAAVDNLIPGIDADCGGECSCATCHVIVDPQWLAKTGAAGDTENSMLDLSQEREDSSRLSCQIPITDELDGLRVRIPEYQV